MKKKLITWLFILLAGFFLSACDLRRYIRVNQSDFIGFRFFLFARVNGKKFQAGGDAMIKKDKLFAFRLYDNLLGKYILFFQSDFSGLQQIALPTEKTLYIKEDKALSLILNKYFYKIIAGELINLGKDDTMIRVEKDQKGRTSYIFNYAKGSYRISILKRFSEGRPSRIKLTQNKNDLIFDIIGFNNHGFESKTEGYSVYRVNNNQAFLEWLGDLYEGK